MDSNGAGSSSLSSVQESPRFMPINLDYLEEKNDFPGVASEPKALTKTTKNRTKNNSIKKKKDLLCRKSGLVTNHAFLKFLKHYKKNHPHLTGQVLIKRVARAWSGMSEDGKNKYREEEEDENREKPRVTKCKMPKEIDCKVQ